MLPLDIDPKLAWALRHRDRFPLDVNRASREELLRVPGFGTKAVERIIATRRTTTIRLSDLARLHVPRNKALPFIVLSDHRPTPQHLDAARADRTVQAEGNATGVWLLMQYIILDTETDFDGWRKAARTLVLHHVKPTDVTWAVQGGEAELFAPPAPSPILEVNDGTFNVSGKIRRPRPGRDPASRCRTFCDPLSPALAAEGQSRSLDVATDPDVAQVTAMARAVHRDEHKMHAFVRFREIGRERAGALRRLVRAGASHRRARRAVLRQALCRHALVDPDARSLRALGWPRALVHAGREQERSAGRRPAGGNLAALLRQHLQSGAVEGEGDAEGDAEEILEEPARGLVH